MDEADARAWIKGVRRVYGVDFSGARLAGVNMWVAELEGLAGGRMPELVRLARMGELAGTDERGPVMSKLTEMVLGSEEAVWGMDFPFALPVELFAAGVSFEEQLGFAGGFTGGAADFGRECVRRCQELTGKMHIRRQTDVESKTPFDCYHYRIVHQTFHGMRDVLAVLRADARTAIWPVRSVRGAKRVVVEACPSSTLKRLGMPHRNYKQVRGPLSQKTLGVRRDMYARLGELVRIPARMQRVISRNPGGDALDAVVAAIGAWDGVWRFGCDASGRYGREGRVYF